MNLRNIYLQKVADQSKKLTNTSAICSVCQSKLPKFPKRSITCKSCSTKLYSQYNLILDKQVLVTLKNRSVLMNLSGYHEDCIKVMNMLGYDLNDKLANNLTNDEYWKILNARLINPNISVQEVLDIQCKMFLTLTSEFKYSVAFERLPAILTLYFGLEVNNRLELDPMLTYGRKIFDMHVLSPLVNIKDMPYLESLFTNPEYKEHYEYFFKIVGFDGELVWDCFKFEYYLPHGQESHFFEKIHAMINKPSRKNEKKSFFSKITGAFLK